MSVERYVEQIPSDQTGSIQLPLERSTGNFLLFQTSAASITITLQYDGVREVFANVTGGIFVRRVKPWRNLRIDGAIGTSITYFHGSIPTDKDETDIRQQVAVISGVTATADSPAATLIDQAPVVCNTAAQTPVFPANLNRRRIKVSFASNAAIPPATAFFRKTGKANNLMEIQPGVVYPFDASYGIDVRNDSGGALSAMLFEEQ